MDGSVADPRDFLPFHDRIPDMEMLPSPATMGDWDKGRSGYSAAHACRAPFIAPSLPIAVAERAVRLCECTALRLSAPVLNGRWSTRCRSWRHGECLVTAVGGLGESQLNRRPHCIRIASCMAPNADAMCQAMASLLEKELRVAVQWIDDVPWYERERMLDAGDIDLCWICGLPYAEKADQGAAIGACVAPVMQHPRYGGQAVYFSDIAVRADSAIRVFADLRGKSWAYNEPRSHSGFNLVRYHLATQGLRWNFFDDVVEAGSHQGALEIVLAGAVAGAAIDSTVLEAELRHRTELA